MHSKRGSHASNAQSSAESRAVLSAAGPAHPGRPARRILSWLRPSALLPILLAPAVPYGGQAAIEGVLMKGKAHAALAMRRRSGRIELLEREVISRFPGLVNVPFVRGTLILVDMMLLGMWALRESGKRYEIDMTAAEEERLLQKRAAEGDADAKAQLERNQASAEAALQEPPAAAESPEREGAVVKQQFTPGEIAMLVISLAISLTMFKVLPAIAATYISGWLGIAGIVAHKARLGFEVGYSADPSFSLQLIVNTIEGLIKFGIFVGYVWLIGRMADVKRLFEYHGAEHIVINAYEDDPKNQDMKFIQSHGVAHPRCGTSFIAIMILLSILLFTVIDWAVVTYLPQFTDPVRNIPWWYIRWPLRIIGVIPLSGISFEVIRSAFRYFGNPLVRPLLKFGMLFQVLTVRRPSDDQVEVSLTSFNRVRELTEGNS
ncbi:DUF1385 domain-containing protein [bacterium]|nr:DUF1385 domain-containing protein [bacterium]